MAKWRTFTFDLMTGTFVAEIRLAGLGFSDRILDAGKATGTLQLPSLQKPRASTSVLPFTTEDDEPIYVEQGGELAQVSPREFEAARAQAFALVDAVEPNRRELVIERNGQIVWCGVIVDAPYDDATETITVTAVEHLAIWRRRVIDTRRFYPDGTDQLAIAQDLVTAMQASTGGDLRITVGNETSGVTRTRTYERFDLKFYGEAIEQLAAVINGFEFAVEASWDPVSGALVKNLRLSYPRRGRIFPETGLIFDTGGNGVDGNIETFTWPNDGTRQSNKVWGTGNGQEEDMLLTSEVDANQTIPLSAGGPGYPLLEEVVAYSTVEDISTLTGHVRARLAAVATPVVLPKVTVRAGAHPEFGSYINGDSCQFLCRPNVSPRFPDGKATVRRIVGRDVTVTDDNDETVELILGAEP